MASIRDLKKDINYLAGEIVTEAYVRKMLFSNVDDETFRKVVTDTLMFRSAILKKINHPVEKRDPKKVKKYFQEVRKEMYQKFSELVEIVSELK
ncbi:hypothetical protein ACT29H_15520 [Thermophagus sp. OGC60D27]|uniref:hypothetical protein n=1 Tax=Thermophagus sp. OGC60D27 TaxID=3458415 RepID=UPI00403760EB